MTPQDQITLRKLTAIAKKVIYDPQRMKLFLKMLGTKDGAVQAVHTVMTFITKATQVPPQLVVQLGVNIYLAMVDMAQEITGAKASPQIVRDVVAEIQKTSPTQQAQPSQPASPQPQSQGIIGQKMGAMA